MGNWHGELLVEALDEEEREGEKPIERGDGDFCPKRKVADAGEQGAEEKAVRAQVYREEYNYE